jgi:hypothetical protein
MKVHILDDSVRLRLDRGEVDATGQGKRVEVSTHFVAAQVFSGSLRVADLPAIQATLRDNHISVVLPLRVADQWASGDTAISIRGKSGPTSLLVEKDFACLEPRRGEDQSNRFPNPRAV